MSRREPPPAPARGRGIVETKKRPAPRKPAVGGVRGQKIGSLAAPARVLPPPQPIRPIEEELGVAPLLAGLGPTVQESVRAKLALLLEAGDARSWVAALLTSAAAQDPPLRLFREPQLGRALSLAIAYALPPGLEAAELVAAVRRLEALRWDTGVPVFGVEHLGGAPMAEGARPEVRPAPSLPEALAELAAGAFAEILHQPEPDEPLVSAFFYWRLPPTLPNEREAGRLEFIARGRATADAWGPPCPHCGSRNTVTYTTQTRSNDEAATENFMCRDCWYTHRS